MICNYCLAKTHKMLKSGASAVRAWLPAAPVGPPRGEPRPPHGLGKASAIKSRGSVLAGILQRVSVLTQDS